MKIYRFMSKREFSMLLNGDNIKDSRKWQNCRTTSEGISFIPNLQLEKRRIEDYAYEDNLMKSENKSRGDIIWNESKNFYGLLNVLYMIEPFQCANVDTSIFVEFEVSDETLVHQCYGQYWEYIIQESYIKDFYNKSIIKPIRFAINLEQLGNSMYRDYDAKISDAEERQLFDINSIMWNDIKDISTYRNTIKQLETASHLARKDSAELAWEEEMEAMYCITR